MIMTVANDKNKNNIAKLHNDKCLPQREFQARNSLFTDLYEIEHARSIRNCYVSGIIILIMHSIIYDVIEPGSTKLGFRYIAVSFGQFDRVILIWMATFLCTLLVYPFFCIWVKFRLLLHPKSILIKIWDRLWLAMFLIYAVTSLYLVPSIKSYYNLHIASSSVVIIEQVRMVMKIHAYIRFNVPHVTSFKQHSEKDYTVPEFIKYLYFLFIPTFIYRNEYPRNKKIRWSYVAKNFLEVAAVIYILSFITGNYLVPIFQNFGLERYNWQTVITSILKMILPASAFLFGTFILLLHSWMNAWAEMLKFADKLFYLDWWNAATYAAYYRKWNVIVHDYLHTYIYRDMYEIVVPGNKVIATCVVFITSAVVHEYIIGCVFGFFFPVMFVQFGVLGMLFTFIKPKDRQFIGNTFLWWSLFVGFGMQVSLYAMEIYARANCPKPTDSFANYFVPRLLSCNRV